MIQHQPIFRARALGLEIGGDIANAQPAAGRGTITTEAHREARGVMIIRTIDHGEDQGRIINTAADRADFIEAGA